MSILVAYITILIVFGIIDAGWLATMGPVLYRPTLGDILLPGLRVTPAIAFYAVYPIGIIVFAVMPGLRTGSLSTVLLLAALYGALAYATYDLTNYATLRNWTLEITLLDIGYGALASGISAAIAYFAVRGLISG